MTSYVRGLCEVLYMSWVAIVILPCVIIYSFARDPVVRGARSAFRVRNVVKVQVLG